MRQSAANGRGVSTEDPARRVSTGRTRIVLLAVIGLLLAGLSPLVIAASPTSAEDATEPTTTTISVNPAVVVLGDPVVFSAVVSGDNFPTPSAAEIVTPGSVRFFVLVQGQPTLCTASLAWVSNTEMQGSCVLSPLATPLGLGPLSIEGSYSGGSAEDGAESSAGVCYRSILRPNHPNRR